MCLSVCVCVYLSECVELMCVTCCRDSLYVISRCSAVTVDTHMTPDRSTGLSLRLSSMSWTWVEVTETETGELGKPGRELREEGLHGTELDTQLPRTLRL